MGILRHEIFFFTCGLINDAFNSSGYIASNDREEWIGNILEEIVLTARILPVSQWSHSVFLFRV
jgi:hypothetical protein